MLAPAREIIGMFLEEYILYLEIMEQLKKIMLEEMYQLEEQVSLLEF